MAQAIQLLFSGMLVVLSVLILITVVCKINHLFSIIIIKLIPSLSIVEATPRPKETKSKPLPVESIPQTEEQLPIETIKQIIHAAVLETFKDQKVRVVSYGVEDQPLSTRWSLAGRMNLFDSKKLLKRN